MLCIFVLGFYRAILDFLLILLFKKILLYDYQLFVKMPKRNGSLQKNPQTFTCKIKVQFTSNSNASFCLSLHLQLKEMYKLYYKLWFFFPKFKNWPFCSVIYIALQSVLRDYENGFLFRRGIALHLYVI